LVPGVRRGLTQMNLVRDVSVTDGLVKVSLGAVALISETQEWLKTKITDAIGKLDGVGEVEVSFTEGKSKDFNDIKNIIAGYAGHIRRCPLYTPISR